MGKRRRIEREAWILRDTGRAYSDETVFRSIWKEHADNIMKFRQETGISKSSRNMAGLGEDSVPPWTDRRGTALFRMAEKLSEWIGAGIDGWKPGRKIRIGLLSEIESTPYFDWDIRKNAPVIAAWMMDEIVRGGRQEELRELLEDAPADEFDLSGMTFPGYSQLSVSAASQIIGDRNSELYDYDSKSGKLILDRALAKGKAGPGKGGKSRERYDRLVSLLPEETAERARNEYKSACISLLREYGKLAGPEIKEFTKNEQAVQELYDRLDSARENREKNSPKAGSPLMVPKETAPLQAKVSVPQRISTFSRKNQRTAVTSAPPGLADGPEAIMGYAMEKSSELLSIMSEASACARYMDGLTLGADGTMRGRSEELRPVMPEIEDPGMILTGLLLEAEAGGDMPWLYLPSSIIAGRCMMLLPWNAGTAGMILNAHNAAGKETDSETCEDGDAENLEQKERKEQKISELEAKEKKLAETGMPGMNRLSAEGGRSIGPVTAAQELYFVSGVVAPHRMELPEAAAKAFPEYAALIAATRRDTEVFRLKREEAEPDEETGDEKDPGLESENLRQELRKLRKKVSGLEQERWAAERKSRDLEEEAGALMEEIAMLRQENASLQDKLWECRENGSYADGESSDESECAAQERNIGFPYTVQSKVVVFGGFPKWQTRMAELLKGDITFTGPDDKPDRLLIRNADIVAIQINRISHGYYWKIKKETEAMGRKAVHIVKSGPAAGASLIAEADMRLAAERGSNSRQG